MSAEDKILMMIVIILIIIFKTNYHNFYFNEFTIS